MATKSKLSKRRAVLAVTLPLALLAAVVLAGSSSTSLPNGAELTVSIEDPVTSTEFQVPVGEATIDVDVSGTASVGLGEPDATFVYVMDVSGSTDRGSGTGCSPILDCEQEFVKALNQAVVADGSVDEVGLVVYASSAATADMSSSGGDQMIIAPNDNGFVNTVVDSTFSVFGGNGGVAQYTNKIVGVETNCTAGLTAALTVVNAAMNSPPHNVVFVSDGLCDDSGGGGLSAFNTAIANLAAADAVVTTIAAGAGSSCEDHEPGFEGTLLMIAQGTGGECFEKEDPGDLPDIIPQLIGSTLESLEIEVNGGGKQPIPNADITPLPLPQAGAIEVSYTTTVTGLGPGDHEICVTANGSDVTGGVADVTQCETIHLLQLVATPPNEVNDLNFDDQHTVTAEVFGGSGPDRDIDFAVGGQNAATATPPNASVLASVNVPVDFVYTVPQDCASLGIDTITVSTVIAGDPSEIELTKEWIDTVPPEVSCDPSVNPHGNEPNAPGHGGQQNPDGFFQLNAEDPYLANCTVTLLVFDGDGFVFPGPFLPGDNIKYTQSDGRPQRQREIGSTNGQAGEVRWHLQGHGDLTVTGTDPSGNSSSAVCLVPPPPM